MRRLRRIDPLLRKRGPVLAVRLEPLLAVQEILRQEDAAIPSVTALAMIDTGASGTVMKASLLAPLGMSSVGVAFVNTPSTTHALEYPEYRVRLVLEDRFAFELDIVATPMGNQPVPCFVGRDILEQWVLTYNGPKNSFALSVRDEEQEH